MKGREMPEDMFAKICLLLHPAETASGKKGGQDLGLSIIARHRGSILSEIPSGGFT